MVKKICENCKNVAKRSVPTNSSGSHYECRFYPPSVVTEEGRLRTRFPKVELDEWCSLGDWDEEPVPIGTVSEPVPVKAIPMTNSTVSLKRGNVVKVMGKLAVIESFSTGKNAGSARVKMMKDGTRFWVKTSDCQYMAESSSWAGAKQ